MASRVEQSTLHQQLSHLKALQESVGRSIYIYCVGVGVGVGVSQCVCVGVYMSHYSLGAIVGSTKLSSCEVNVVVMPSLDSPARGTDQEGKGDRKISQG